jgi:hypothetical protein
MCLFNAQAYEDVATMGLGPYQYAVYDLGASNLRFNLIRAVVDSYVAQISQTKPKPRALTSDGNWTLKRKAEGLTRWWEGWAEDTELYRVTSQPCCRDSAVFNFGLAKVYRKWPERKDLWDVGVERTFPWEIFADDAEAQQPTNLMTLGQRKWYDRTVLAEMFPSKKREIMGYSPASGMMAASYDMATNSVADLVAVHELWRLPAYPDSKDGRRVICIEGDTLVDEVWDRPRFPFARLYREQPSQGIWGVSIPHELRGMQVFINRTVTDAEDCMQLFGKPRMLAKVGSVQKEFLSDDHEDIVEWSGDVEPHVVVNSPFPPELWSSVWMTWSKGFEQIGMNEQTAKAALPEGLSGSGASIRAWDDVQSGRLYEASLNREDWHMKLAELAVDEARDIAKERPDFASAYRGKKYVQIVRFRDVDPGKDRFYFKAWPESRLSKAPAQRLAQLQELFNSQIIGPDEFRELLAFPDLDDEDNLVNAPRELAEKLIEQMLDAKDVDDPDLLMYPEPEWPLEGPRGIMTRIQYAIVRARLDGAPDKNVMLMQQFLRLCDAVLAKKAQLAASGQAPQPYATPPAQPGQAPAQAPPPQAQSAA